MRFYLKKEVKQLLNNSDGEIKTSSKSSFHLAKGTSDSLYQIKGITSSNEPNIIHISEDVNVLNKDTGKISHTHKNYKLKKSGIKNLLKESPLKLTDKKKKDIKKIKPIIGVFRKLHQPASSPPEIMHKLPISGEKEVKKDIKKDIKKEKKIVVVSEKKSDKKLDKKKVSSKIKKDEKKGEKKIKSEIEKLKKDKKTKKKIVKENK